MDSYLTDEIGMVMPLLEQTCAELTKQVLIRELTAKTKEWCEGDPELAEKILDGKKTLENCVRYVMEQAAKVIAKQVSAMSEQEIGALPQQQINGRTATMAGGVVSSDDAFNWAHEYYYTEKGPTPNVQKTVTKTEDTKKKDAGKKKSGNGQPKTVAAPLAAPAKKEDGVEQLSMFAAAAAAPAA